MRRSSSILPIQSKGGMWVVLERNKTEYKIMRKKEATVEFKLVYMTLHKTVEQTIIPIAAKIANCKNIAASNENIKRFVSIV